MSPLPYASPLCFLVTGSLVKATLLMALIVPDMLLVIGLNVAYGYYVVRLAVGVRPTVVALTASTYYCRSTWWY